MRPGLRSRNMEEHDQVEDLQQQIENLNRMLRDRNDQIAELQERQDQLADLDAPRVNPGPANLIGAAIPPAPEMPRNPAINIDAECQRGKVPDLIKNLPIFAGNPKQVNHWITCADRVIRQYDHIIGTDVYELWLMEIRNKIVGEAGDLLASSGTPLEWDKIKTQLKIIYGDKRELSTLLQRLFSLKQNRNPVRNFYTAISDCYTGISTHIQMDVQWQHPEELVKFVEKLCLEKFIDGLDEPFSSHVGLHQPTNLASAYQYANDKVNKIARRNGEYDLENRPHQKPDPNIQHARHAVKPTPPIPNRQFYNTGNTTHGRPSFNPGQYRPFNNFQPGPSRPASFQINGGTPAPNHVSNPPRAKSFSNYKPMNAGNAGPSRPYSQQTRFFPRQNHELSNQDVQEHDYSDETYHEHDYDFEYPNEEYPEYQSYESHDNYPESGAHNEANFQTVAPSEKLS